ncbi:MAG: hypothetical protein EBZ49_03020 [Proteobacteria bacterium]|nr:hypothetical protein [Pseudomonadota bacterium]
MRLNPEQKQRVLDMFKQGKSKDDIMTESGFQMNQINGILRRDKDKNNTVEMPSESPETEVLEINEDLAGSFAQAIEVPPPETKEDSANFKRVIKLAKETRTPKVSRTKKNTEETDEPKESVVSRIVIQVETFEPLLNGIIGDDKQEFLKSLPKRSLVELKALEKVIMDTVKIGNLTNQLRHIYYMLCSGLEVGTSAIGLKSQGYTKVMMSQDKEVKMILQEMALQYKDKIQVSTRPELRLAMISVSSLLATDARNRTQVPAPVPAPVPASVPAPVPTNPEPVAEKPRGNTNVKPMFGANDYSDL